MEEAGFFPIVMTPGVEIRKKAKSFLKRHVVAYLSLTLLR